MSAASCAQAEEIGNRMDLAVHEAFCPDCREELEP